MDMKLEEILQERFPNIDIDDINLSEMYSNILDTESLKIKILKKTKCKRCGWCCKFQSPMLTLEDIKLLCKYLDYNEKDLYERYMDKTVKIPYLKSPCPFLGRESECTIYHVRPKVCKIFPFVDFFLVTDPCLIGKELLNIVVKNGATVNQSDENLQKMFDDRIKLLDAIAGTEQPKGAQYQSIFIDKNILIGLIKLLKRNNG